MTGQHDNPGDQPPIPRQGSSGRFAPRPETQLKRARACELAAQGLTYRAIAAEMGVDVHTAYGYVQDALKATLKEPAENLVRLESERIDFLYSRALEILERSHVTVSHGKVICDDTGQPIPDDGPKLAAIREMRTLRESFRKLRGLDSPSKVSIDAQNLGAEIGDMLAQLAGDTDGHPDDHT